MSRPNIAAARTPATTTAPLVRVDSERSHPLSVELPLMMPAISRSRRCREGLGGPPKDLSNNAIPRPLERDMKRDVSLTDTLWHLVCRRRTARVRGDDCSPPPRRGDLMRRIGRLVALGVVASGSAVVTLVAAPALVDASPSEARSIGGSTTFVWRGRKAATVNLTSSAVLDIAVRSHDVEGPNRAIRIAGKGSFVGLVISRGGSDRADVVAGRFSLCPQSPCPDKRTFNVVMAETPGDGTTVTLDPGRYVVYGIAEGPARVRLEFRGPQGAELVPLEEVATVSSPRSTTMSMHAPGGSFYSSGASYSMGGSGFSLGAVALAGRDVRLGRVGDCLYSGEPMLPPHLAYGPQCVALAYARGTGGTEFQVVDPPGRAFAMFFLRRFTDLDATEGRRGYGFWATAHPRAEFIGSHAFFLTF